MKLTEEGTDSLFQQYSIKEIQEIEGKLRNDIEKKKEDLRQMVGERYQDMMYAADTITDMKLSAISVTNHIKAMENHCCSMYQQATPTGILGHKENLMPSRFSIGAQLKIVMDTSAKLWSAIDEHRFSDAAEIYLLSQYVISAFVYGPASLLPDGKNLQKTFPVLSSQMAQCHSYRSAVLQKCHQSLENENLNENEMSDIFCALLLLDDVTHFDLLQDFLNGRASAICQILNKEDLTISQQVCEAVSLFCNTLQRLGIIFYSTNEQNSVLLKRYLEIGSLQRLGPIMHFTTEASPTFPYLSSSIKKFRPSLKTDLKDVPMKTLQETCQKWMTDVTTKAQLELTRLLNFVGSSKGLATICQKVKESFQQISTSDWTLLCENVLEGSFSPYEVLLKPVVSQRLKEVLSSGWTSAFLDLHSQLIDLLQLASKNGGCESDLRHYVWEESPGDLIGVSGWPGSTEHFGKLGMKANGFTPQIQNLCRSFDERIRKQLDDLEAFGEVYLETKEEQMNFVRKLTQENIEKLLEFLKNTGRDERTKHGLPAVGRFCRAICDLCPGLQQCFSKNEEILWNDIVTKVLETGQQALRAWISYIVRKELDTLKHNLSMCSPDDMLRCAMAWDEREINEETEDGGNLRSQIRVPLQPSGFIQAALASIAQEINHSIGHSLNKDLILSTGQEILQLSLVSYQATAAALSKEGLNPRFVQSFSLQLLFDVHYLGGLFGDNKASYSSTDSVTSAIENLIDPFDLDVFNPVLQANLALAMHKSTLLFGLLLIDRQISFPSLATQPPLSNLLLTTGGVARFQVLPITQKTDKMSAKFSAPASTSPPKMARGFGSSPALGGLSDSSDVSKSFSFYDRFSAMGASWFGSNT